MSWIIFTCTGSLPAILKGLLAIQWLSEREGSQDNIRKRRPRVKIKWHVN